MPQRESDSSRKCHQYSDTLLGEQIYAEACASCHGWTGKSPISGLATIAGARSVNDPSGVNVAQVILFGGGPARRSGDGDAGLRRRLFGRRDRGRRQLCHGAVRRCGLTPDGGERRLATAHPVTDHLLHESVCGCDPTLRMIKSSGPLVVLVGGALRWLRRENEHPPVTSLRGQHNLMSHCSNLRLYLGRR
jgi:hypothetical protein